MSSSLTFSKLKGIYFKALRRGSDRWGADRTTDIMGDTYLMVREKPSVTNVYPGSMAAGAGHANRPLTVGPGKYCSPRHTMPFNPIKEGLRCGGVT